jgi:hypothetical protein
VGSLYPTTSNYATLISQAKTNIASMSSTFGKWSVVSEFGIAENSGSTGATALKSARTICTDLFYWEPEAYNWQSYGLGAWDPTTKEPTVVLTSGLKSAEAVTEANAMDEAPGINLYPNPCSGGTLTLDLKNVLGATTIRVINVNGKVLNEQTVYEQVVDLSSLNLAKGVYFVQVTNAQIKEVRTLIVK